MKEWCVKDVLLAMEMAKWVNGLAPWQVIAHLTFSWEASLPSAQRCYERFMKRQMPGVSYFYACERNPARDGFHVHCLWMDCRSVNRRHVWSEWFARYGRARIEPVKDQGDVSGYCAKYVTKEGAWWDVKIQPHLMTKGNI
jgi:hypothetical protein